MYVIKQLAYLKKHCFLQDHIFSEIAFEHDHLVQPHQQLLAKK